MTAAKCPACHAKQGDWLLCRSCVAKLRHDLGQLNENWVILQEVIARITKRGDSSGETPVVFNQRASEVAWEVRNTLSSWVRLLDDGSVVKLRDTIRAMTNWLIDHLQTIRGHQAAGEIFDEIRYACRSVLIAIDLPPDLRLVGKCQICDAELMAPLSAQVVVCRRCEKAGINSVYNVPEMRQALAERVEEEHVSRVLALQVVAKVWGIEINGSTFRGWLSRGKLTVASVTPTGVPMYRVGDVLDLAQGIERAPEGAA